MPGHDGVGRPRTRAQWLDYQGALDRQISAEDEALANRLVAPGHHPSMPGFNDLAYPLNGR